MAPEGSLTTPWIDPEFGCACNETTGSTTDNNRIRKHLRIDIGPPNGNRSGCQVKYFLPTALNRWRGAYVAREAVESALHHESCRRQKCRGLQYWPGKFKYACWSCSAIAVGENADRTMNRRSFRRQRVEMCGLHAARNEDDQRTQYCYPFRWRQESLELSCFVHS